MLNILVAPRDVNPLAENHTKKIVKYLKSQQAEYSVYFSKTVDDIKINTKKILSSGETDLIIVGEDNIIHEVVASVKDLNKVKIGIVPTSKKDDFATYLGISQNPVQAIKDILKNHLENIDLLVVNGTPVVNNLLIGASVEINHQHNQFKMKNFFTQKFAERKYGKSYAGIDLFLDNKNKTKKETVYELVVANGGLSKGKPVSPLANTKDGLFNLCYSTTAHKHGRNNFLKQFNKGEHIYNEETKQFWLTNLKITNPDKKIKTMIDGKIETVEELNISILENCLKIYTKP